MNLQSQSVTAALKLAPVYPPQWVTPVQPPSIAHGGLPLSAFTSKGLEVVLEPITGLLNWAVAAFDVVTLFVNGVRTNVSKTIMPGEEGDRFLLYLAELWFTNGVNDVHYQVTRVSGNKDDSPTLQLLYHKPAPTITVSHPPSIGPGQPAVITITVGYPRPHDTVTLTIGIWSITFTNPDPTKPITHTLTAAELQQIGDGTHTVIGTVRDQLTNSDVSATTLITITANQRALNPPIIVEAEANNRVLDVGALNGKNATIHARTWTDMVPGQQCWMRIESFKADGSQHDLQLWNGSPAMSNLTWISVGYYVQGLLNSHLAALGNGKPLTLKFWVSEDKSNNFATATPFRDQVYTIKAAALVAPTITNVTEDTATGTPVANGGFTTATTLALTGTASPNQQIHLLDDDEVQDTITVPTSGRWAQTLTKQAEGSHRYQAKALNADGLISEDWKVTIVAQLSIDKTPMRLDGVKFIHSNPGIATKEVPRNTMVRPAVGGVPTTSYRSSNPAIAHVSAEGKVTGRRNGAFTITATDGAGSQVSYDGSVMNVFDLILSAPTDRRSFSEIHAWGLAQGGIQLPGANDAGPVIRAFSENFIEPRQIFRSMLPGHDPRNWVWWQAPTRDNLVAGFVISDQGHLIAIAYGQSGTVGFEGPSFTLRHT